MSLALLGCRKEQVEVYETAKESAPPPAAMSPAAGSPHGEIASPQIHWTVPEGWQEQPAGGMRFASFVIPGEGDAKANVAVVPIAGVAGRDLDIVNIFRDGAKLPPVTEPDLAKLGEKVAIGALEGRVFDMSGEGTNTTRLVVGVLNQSENAWYFRLSGPAPLVDKAKPDFIKFLNSSVVEQGPPGGMPPGHPPLGSARPMMPAGTADAAPGHPAWTVPAAWKELPPTQMVLARFQAGADDGKAEITVSSFPGDVGGLVANVNRWRGQIGLPGVDQAAVDQMATSLDTPAGKAIFVDMTGTKDGRAVRLTGVVQPHAGKTWFYKCMGDAQVVEREKAALVEFVKSVHLP